MTTAPGQLPELDAKVCPWCEQAHSRGAGFAWVRVNGWRVPMHHTCQAEWDLAGRPDTSPITYERKGIGGTEPIRKALVRNEFLKPQEGSK